MTPTPVPTPEEAEKYLRQANAMMHHRTKMYVRSLTILSLMFLTGVTLVIDTALGYTFLTALGWAVIITAAYVAGSVGGYRFGGAAITLLPPK